MRDGAHQGGHADVQGPACSAAAVRARSKRTMLAEWRQTHCGAGAFRASAVLRYRLDRTRYQRAVSDDASADDRTGALVACRPRPASTSTHTFSKGDSTHLGGLEGVVGREMDIYHEDTARVGAVARPARKLASRQLLTSVAVSTGRIGHSAQHGMSLPPEALSQSKPGTVSGGSAPHDRSLPMEEVILRNRTCKHSVHVGYAWRSGDRSVQHVAVCRLGPRQPREHRMGSDVGQRGNAPALHCVGGSFWRSFNSCSAPHHR